MVRRAANGRCLVDMSYSAGSRCTSMCASDRAYSHILREASASLLVPTIPGIPEPQDVGTGSKYGSHAFSLPVSKPLFFQWQRLQEGAASRIYSYATTIFICILAESLIRVAPTFLSELYAVSSTNSVV